MHHFSIKNLLLYNIDPELSHNYSIIFPSKTSKNPILYGHYDHSCAKEELSAVRVENYYTIFIFKKCNFDFIFDDIIYHPKPGDVIAISRCAQYIVNYYKSDSIEYYELNFPVSFFEDFFEDSTSVLNIFYNKNTDKKYNIYSLANEHNKEILSYLNKLDALSSKENVLQNMLSFSYIIQIFSIIATQKNHENMEIYSKIPTPLANALRYIHKNFTNIQNISEISSELHFSTVYISRLFKENLDCTLLEYISNLRLLYSIQLIESGASITDACYQSGFSSYTYFITQFKKKFGITPGKFKRNHTKNYAP